MIIVLYKNIHKAGISGNSASHISSYSSLLLLSSVFLPSILVLYPTFLDRLFHFRIASSL